MNTYNFDERIKELQDAEIRESLAHKITTRMSLQPQLRSAVIGGIEHLIGKLQKGESKLILPLFGERSLTVEGKPVTESTYPAFNFHLNDLGQKIHIVSMPRSQVRDPQAQINYTLVDGNRINIEYRIDGSALPHTHTPKGTFFEAKNFVSSWSNYVDGIALKKIHKNGILRFQNKSIGFGRDHANENIIIQFWRDRFGRPFTHYFDLMGNRLDTFSTAQKRKKEADADLFERCIEDFEMNRASFNLGNYIEFALDYVANYWAREPFAFDKKHVLIISGNLVGKANKQGDLVINENNGTLNHVRVPVGSQYYKQPLMTELKGSNFVVRPKDSKTNLAYQHLEYPGLWTVKAQGVQEDTVGIVIKTLTPGQDINMKVFDIPIHLSYTKFRESSDTSSQPEGIIGVVGRTARFYTLHKVAHGYLMSNRPCHVQPFWEQKESILRDEF
jgi:hypothetical protein